MCGIVGIIGGEDIITKVISSLKKLEYRGYDSSGIAFLSNQKIKVIKEEGKIIKLENEIKKSQSENIKVAIGHTRWATHGRPSKENAHPHSSEKISVVHNGIIENYQEIKGFLSKKKIKFLSETDSETLPHLLEFYLEETGDIKKAVIKMSEKIRGAYSLAVIFRDKNDLILAIKKGSPLLVGFGQNANYIASDYYALSDYTNKITYLDDGEFALINSASAKFFNFDGAEIKKSFKTIKTENNNSSKGGFDHFMLKEIHEQPRVISDTLENYVDLKNSEIYLPKFPFDFNEIKKITIIACGTSYYAGSLSKYLFEEIAKIETEVDIASEFRYREHPFRSDNLMIFISQSGETADTIAALKYAKKNKQKTLAIVNVAESTMAQLADAIIKTVAGIEIGVASTKAYTAQVATLGLLAIEIANTKKNITKEERIKYIQSLASVSAKLSEVLNENQIKNIKKIAKSLINAKHILYIGRGISYITALESALKLREISYIDAYGVASGELKHGTIALIDKKMPVIAIAPSNFLLEKTLSNMEEVKARGGKLIVVSDKNSTQKMRKLTTKIIEVPSCDGIIQEALIPVVATQLLAYYVALFKGNDVDQPRNLAKSVTVE
jgi:glucosamine--fructose-6-phosphate aminotransferase (isomerizing)